MIDSREEDLSFLTKEYAEGMRARGQGKSLKDNPYRSKIALWNAGWVDQDTISLTSNQAKDES